MAQLVKNPPAMQETWVRSLGWEDPLEKGKATHSSILAWRIPWTVRGVTKSRTRLSNFIFSCAGSPLLSGLLSSCDKQGYSLVVVCGRFMVVASPAAEHRLWSTEALVAAAHGL